MPKTSIVAYVYGRVQGVGFRCATQQQANRLGLSGHVKNLDDGSVEVVVCGGQQQVHQLLAWIKAGGPPYATVERILTEPRASAQFDGFAIGD